MGESTSKVAIVTGASRGIGQAIALKLGQQGFCVAGTATTQAGAERISDYLTDSGYQGMGFVLDVVNQESVDAFLAQVQDVFSAPAVLINNAGITRDGLAMRMKLDDWDAVIETNLTSVFRLSKGVMKSMMKARWGRIVNISSVVASTGNAGQLNYCAAKAGMVGATKSMAIEFASRNITVNAVAPGFIETDMTQQLSEDQRASLSKTIPMNRLGTVDDVANAVSFLVSDESSYITGQTIHINGGMYTN